MTVLNFPFIFRCWTSESLLPENYEPWISLQHYDSPNSKPTDLLDSIRIIREEIGDRRLRLSCWPFKYLKLSDFLRNCFIPYQFVYGSSYNSHDGFLFCDCHTLYFNVNNQLDIIHIHENPDRASQPGYIIFNPNKPSSLIRVFPRQKII